MLGVKDGERGGEAACSREESSFCEARQDQGLGFLQRGDGLCAADSGILLQELVQAAAGLQIIQEVDVAIVLVDGKAGASSRTPKGWALHYPHFERSEADHSVGVLVFRARHV